MTSVESFVMMGVLIGEGGGGAFELLLGGVSHIAHKALPSIAGAECPGIADG